jgi:hypothetical protein
LIFKANLSAVSEKREYHIRDWWKEKVKSKRRGKKKKKMRRR